ncbi:MULTISPECIES: ATP-binding protein [unclassified Streptomyces]|uniref:ATP-binding protein n=1 Tax=unclassified Streptomyces TaxID=2593676 RepID=UPI000698A976|nr:MULTISPECIES: ATP-binding protein [unclassified Streptomyces]
MNTRRETLDEKRTEVRPVRSVLPAGGHQRRRTTFAGQHKPVARAREFTLAALTDWAWPEAGDVVLLVAELTANAVLHTDGPLELVLDLSPARLRIEVSDTSPVLPAPRRPHHPGLPGGHGLYIVQQASDRWGAVPHERGKTVWAEIDARPVAVRF